MKKNDVCVVVADCLHDSHRLEIGSIVLIKADFSPYSDYPCWCRTKELNHRGNVNIDFKKGELVKIGKL